MSQSTHFNYKADLFHSLYPDFAETSVSKATRQVRCRREVWMRQPLHLSKPSPALHHQHFHTFPEFNARKHSYRGIFRTTSCAVRQSSCAMAKKKAAAPPEQFAGPSLIICRNK